MSKAFVVKWMEGQKVEKPLKPKKALSEFHDRLERIKGPYRLKREREDFSWGPPLPLREVIKRVKALEKDAPVGDLIRVEGASGRILGLLRVETDPPVTLPAGSERWNPLIQDIYVFAFDPKQPWAGHVHFAGAENCRPNRRDSHLWSMHCYWSKKLGVLAIDVGVDSLSTGDRFDAAVQKKWPYPRVVTVWRQPLHFTHDHCQVGHNQPGIPACAR